MCMDVCVCVCVCEHTNLIVDSEVSCLEENNCTVYIFLIVTAMSHSMHVHVKCACMLSHQMSNTQAHKLRQGFLHFIII